MKTWKSKRPISFLLILSLIAAIFISGKFIYTKTHRPKKNVILIIVDALRPDHLGCYGYERKTSPNIDNLAKEGVLFTQTIAQGNCTPLSVPSILTSTYPHTHWVKDFGYQLNPSILTLAQVLKDYGYSTGFISEPDILHTIRGLERGFDIFNETGEVTKTAIDWLKDVRDRPFLLYLHYGSPHCPYRPPPPYNRMFLADKFKRQDKDTLEAKYQWAYDPIYLQIPKQIAEGNLAKEDVDYYISQYDGEIRFDDQQIGILLKRLKRLNLDKKTIIILTADHGEDLADHDINNAFKHSSAYDVVLKVPLIIKCTDIIPENKIITQQVQSIDIMPTIIDMLKIKKPETTEGVSLLPLILKGKEYPIPYAFSRSCVIRTEEWKLICNRRNRQLYNLKKDPQELNNLIEQEKEKFIFLKEKLDNWRKQAVAIPKKPAQLTEEEKERLRSLGYLH